MNFEGKIVFMSDVTTVGQNNTEKRTVVLEETKEEYPNSVVLDVIGKGVKGTSGLKVGDVVIASLSFKAKEYNGKWYNSVGAWRFEKSSNAASIADDIDDDELF